jgi:ABC-type transport system involved in cytochrome bd biosynthesis fused ATPase/permease subunit
MSHPGQLIPLQYEGFHGQMASGILDAIIAALQKHSVLPPGYQRPSRRVDSPMNLTRLASVVIGREGEQQEIMRQLQKGKAVVLWGGPGEGKSTLAMDAACTLYKSGALPGGALSVDLTGAPTGCQHVERCTGC